YETLDKDRIAVAGIGYAGVVALCAAGLFPDHVASVAAVNSLNSFVTDQEYAAGTPMSLLTHGILIAGDISHIAAMTAPRKLVIAGGLSPQGKQLTERELMDSFAFTMGMYKLLGAENRLTIRGEMKAEEIATAL